MRSQEGRDTVTVAISTALLMFALVLAAGAALMFVVDRFFGEGAVLDMLGYVVLTCATGVSILYLWHHRRP